MPPSRRGSGTGVRAAPSVTRAVPYLARSPCSVRATGHPGKSQCFSLVCRSQRSCQFNLQCNIVVPGLIVH